MNGLSEDALNEKLAGIQLALFELIWPAFTWIKSIYAAADPQKCFIHIRADEPPSHAEWDDCVRLLNEIFASAAGNSKLSVEAECSGTPPPATAFREIMSQAIFELIATDVAPWRLHAGR
ncbi:hypothetical protein JQ609_11535 [Bradyrhizobium sp. AUGA SZCCT0169]|uniref:hypothetical protein n=1 Tax=Bradyrhizobium sp. AUGA SZCCT0169 TaxID=2807663 RepID=UPI001BAB2692|nr:hypothetical protein [Bradyrhizobium sp. AUGA SZCCT0169]MBR1247566.1 hypothetical protein [Bradyrhizobium sp. AUGA SZCCT0169]